jgi:hypothetical protein
LIPVGEEKAHFSDDDSERHEGSLTQTLQVARRLRGQAVSLIDESD